MAAIDNRQLTRLTNALEKNGIEYLYIGKSAAIIHGFADTTQDADIYVRPGEKNKESLIAALKDIGFQLTEEQEKDVRGGRDFIQLHNGPFDLDLIYAPDGIERFEDAWERGRRIDGHRVCSIDDVIASKKSANRAKDRESLTRLEAFSKYLKERPERGEKLPLLEPTWRDRTKAEIDASRSGEDKAAEPGDRTPGPARRAEIGRQAPAPKAAPESAQGASETAEEDQQRDGQER